MPTNNEKKAKPIKKIKVAGRWFQYKRLTSSLSKKRKLLLELSLELVNCTDKEELYETCLRKLQEGLGYDNAYLLLRESPRGKIRLIAYKGEEIDEEEARRVIDHGIGLTGRAIKCKKPVISNDVTKDPYYVKGNDKTLSEMVVPVMCDEIIWGVLIIDSHKKDAFIKLDAQIVQVFCNYLASALTRLYQLERLKYKSNMESAILDIVTKAAREKHIEKICQDVVKELSKMTRFTQIYILKTLDETTGASQLIAGRGPGSFDEMSQIESGRGLVGKTIRARKTLYFPDVSQAPEYVEVDQKTKSELDIPIIHEDKLYGVLSLESPELDGFDQGDIELMEILAKHLGVLWAYSDLLEKTKREALKDPLTGLWNRRHFYDCVSKEMDRHKRQNDTFCIVMVDLSKFKEINDTYGHSEGDKVLIQVGNFLMQRIRSSDILARYGGDEFVALLPHTQKADAQIAWSRLANEIQRIPLGDHGLHISFEYGIASYPEDGTRASDLIKAADEALYIQKRTQKKVLRAESRPNPNNQRATHL